MKIIFSLVYWVFVLLSCAVLFMPALLIWALTVLFDKKLKILHLYSSFWGSIYIFFNPLWRLKIEGRKKIRTGETYVMISNHQSALDVLVIYSLFKHFKWVSKIENFKIPFVGWNMTLNRYIRLNRGSSSSFLKMVRESEKALKEGNSIMIFPEGTRSTTYQLRNFKEGAFHIALRNKKPILPIVLNGTGESLPKKGFIFRKNSRIRVRVLDPVPFENFSELTPAELAQKLKDLMTKEHEKLKEEVS